jgi:hypothetical protein
MSFSERVKEAVLSHAVQAAVAAITVLLAWASSIIGPAVAPVILAAIPMQALLPLLLLSLLINLVLMVLLYLTTRKQELQLYYNIYWDTNKNPHCPTCTKPVAYNEYAVGGWGYYCPSCKHVYPLVDASGKTVKPEQVLAEL